MSDLSIFANGPQQGPTGLRQGGMTLVVSLIFLLILTILGVTAMNTNTLQQKMAGNMRDADMALQVAETGLRGAEAALNALWVNGKPIADTTGSSGVWLQGSTNTLDSSWWDLKSKPYNGPVTNGYENPHYVIEESECFLYDIPNKKGWLYYRITSSAKGMSPASRAMIEEMYQIPVSYCPN